MSTPSPGPTQAHILWVPGFFPWAWRSQDKKLTNYLCLVPRLRMSGGVPLLPLFAFMAWTGTALPFCMILLALILKFPYFYNLLWLKRKRPQANQHIHALYYENGHQTIEGWVNFTISISRTLKKRRDEVWAEM